MVSVTAARFWPSVVARQPPRTADTVLPANFIGESGWGQDEWRACDGGGGNDTAAVVKRFRNRAAIIEQAARETTDPESKAEAQRTADTISRAADYFGARQFDDLQVLIENCDGPCHVWNETVSSLATLYGDCDA